MTTRAGRARPASRTADALRQAIRDSGRAVARIAREVGMTGPQLHHFVHGHSNVSVETMERLMEYFGFEMRRRPPPPASPHSNSTRGDLP